MPPDVDTEADEDGDSTADPPSPERPKASDLLAQYGSDMNAALRMAERLSAIKDDNYKLRGKNRQLRDDIAGLRGKAAPEGSVILSADDAKAWEAYKALGSEPAALKQALTERDDAKQRLTTLEREKTIRDVAEVAKYKAAVLGQLPGSADLAFDIRDVTQDGATVRMVYVKDGERQVPLTDYAEQHWADFLPALRVEAPLPSGTAYVAQSTGGKVAAKNLVDQHLEQQAARRAAQTNPLLKQRTI
jgi:hypothetical protein